MPFNITQEIVSAIENAVSVTQRVGCIGILKVLSQRQDTIFWKALIDRVLT